MKRIIPLLIFIVLTCSLFAQSAKDNVRSFAASKNYSKAVAYIYEAVKENRKDIELMLLAGDIYTELENLDSALILYEKADDIDSDEPVVMRKIALALSALGRHLDAIEMLKDAIDEDKDDVYTYLCMGQVYLAADSLNESELFITKARSINKHIPDAFIALGDLYFAQRVYELAKNNYEEALSIDEENVEARTKLAISYYWLANREYDEDLANEFFKKSLKEWNIITKKDTMNAKAYYEQGRILFFSKKWDKSAKSLYRYVQLRPKGKLGRWYLAQSLYELAQCDSAEPHLMKAAEEIDSVKNKALLLLARCYFDAKEYEKSLLTFDRLKELEPLKTIDLERYGAAAFSIGDTVLAVKSYQEAIELDPKRCKLMYKTGLMLYKLKKYDEAIVLFNKRIINCDDKFTAKSYFFIGISYFLNEKPDSAVAGFIKSYELDSTSLKSLIYLADAYAAQGQNDTSAYYLEFVIEKALADTLTFKWELNSSFSKLCGLYLKNKKYNKLKKTGQRWTKAKPKYPNAYFYLAISYQATNDIANACKNYKLTLRYDSKHKFAKEYIKKLNCQ